MLLTPERSNDVKARIQNAVEDALKARAVSARRASLDVVGNDGLIRDIRAGRLPGVDRLEALFEYLGLDFHFGPRRVAQAALSGEAPRAPNGFVTVAWHPQSKRAGSGPLAPVSFARDWLEAAGLSPATLAAVHADGTHEGEVALIDTAARQKDGPALWCLREGGRLVLACAQFDSTMTIVWPEGASGRARVVQGDDRAKLTFLGRVVWTGALRTAS